MEIDLPPPLLSRTQVINTLSDLEIRSEPMEVAGEGPAVEGPGTRPLLGHYFPRMILWREESDRGEGAPVVAVRTQAFMHGDPPPQLPFSEAALRAELGLPARPAPQPDPPAPTAAVEEPPADGAEAEPALVAALVEPGRGTAGVGPVRCGTAPGPNPQGGENTSGMGGGGSGGSGPGGNRPPAQVPVLPGKGQGNRANRPPPPRPTQGPPQGKGKGKGRGKGQSFLPPAQAAHGHPQGWGRGQPQHWRPPRALPAAPPAAVAGTGRVPAPTHAVFVRQVVHQHDTARGKGQAPPRWVPQGPARDQGFSPAGKGWGKGGGGRVPQGAGQRGFTPPTPGHEHATCHRCKEKGHLAKECQMPNKRGRVSCAPAQGEGDVKRRRRDRDGEEDWNAQHFHFHLTIAARH